MLTTRDEVLQERALHPSWSLGSTVQNVWEQVIRFQEQWVSSKGRAQPEEPEKPWMRRLGGRVEGEEGERYFRQPDQLKQRP